MKWIDLNCDLGEGVGAENELLQLCTTANVACGFHAGDAETAEATLKAAAAVGVRCGAHPSYPDRANFGRAEMPRTPELVFTDCVYQIGAMMALAKAVGWPLIHVKPHGALYNVAARRRDIADAVVNACVQVGLELMGLPGSELEKAARGKVPFVPEGFADRRYAEDGTLVPRTEPGAMITSISEAVAQAQRLLEANQIRTLCVHGDNPRAIEFVRGLREGLKQRGFEIRPFA